MTLRMVLFESRPFESRGAVVTVGVGGGIGEFPGWSHPPETDRWKTMAQRRAGENATGMISSYFA